MMLEEAHSRIWCSKIGWQTVPCSWSIDGEAALTNSSPGTRDQQSPRCRGMQLPATMHGVGWHTQVSQAVRVACSINSPELTCKNGQMFVCPSVHPCGVNIFKTLRLQDSWANIDEIWHVYSTGRGTKLQGSRIFNFGPGAAWGHRKLSPIAFYNSVYRTLQLHTYSQRPVPPKNLPLGNSQHLCNIISVLINYSVNEGCVPSTWKHAVITPAPKVKPVTKIADLRPISVTLLSSRILQNV